MNTLKTCWYWLAVWFCRVICTILFRLRIDGKENIPKKGAFVLISNHQSFLDPVFCGIHLKRQLYFLARDTLFKNRFFGRLLASVHATPVKRGQADLGAMRKVISRLKEGFGICLFPEGTRTQDGMVSPFKPGFGLLCRRGNAAVIPVIIDGAFECWPRGRKIFTLGSRIVIRYDKAITAEEVKKTSDKELAEKLTERLQQMQNQCRTEQGKEPYCY